MGSAQGMSLHLFGLTPVDKYVTEAIKNDDKLYELLVLLGCVRGGVSVREQEVAINELIKHGINFIQ